MRKEELIDRGINASEQVAQVTMDFVFRPLMLPVEIAVLKTVRPYRQMYLRAVVEQAGARGRILFWNKVIMGVLGEEGRLTRMRAETALAERK